MRFLRSRGDGSWRFLNRIDIGLIEILLNIVHRGYLSLLGLNEALRLGESETLVKSAESGNERQANDDTPCC